MCLSCNIYSYCNGNSGQRTHKVSNPAEHSDTGEEFVLHPLFMGNHWRCFEHQDDIEQCLASPCLQRTYER